jgi:endonuclease/exonuclease/phosphatase family metal-dependent hydrolase
VFFLRSFRSRFWLCALVLLSGLVPALRADERIRIVAANLTSGNGQNYDPGHGNRILQGLKPDIVLVQEFNYLNNTAADFRAWVDANFGTTFYYTREPSPGQIPNGIVSRYPILASGEWEDTNVSNRDFSWARIDIPGDKDLWAISVHLLTTSSGNRNAEASQILNYIAAQGVPAADYVVLGGDFNTDSRTEACINTLSSYFVTSGPYPVDQSNNGNTNSGRNKPYDWVLADTELHAVKTSVVLGANTFTNGLVFDSRVYSPLPSPVLAGDSAASNMQHMAVVRDFLIPANNAPAIPTIYSATAASGVAGQVFNYQIAATNSPTAFAASGLPTGLSVNTTSGLISGTPTAAGGATVTLSATNAVGTSTASLALTINAASTGGGGGTLFAENMGIPTGNTLVSVYVTGTAPATFQNKGTLTFGQGEQAAECDVRGTSGSSGYSGASGGGNVWFASASTRGFSIEGIDAASYSGLKLNFGYRKELTSVHAALAVDYWNGSAWVSLANSASALFGESATAGVGWYLSNTLSLPSGAQINGLKIRFVKTGTDNIRIDDVKLTGTPVATPILTTGGALAAVDAVYGDPSPAPTSFSVAGAGLTAGILVTPPAGFEVSQTAGGASGYATTQTVGAAGTVTATTIYVRLAAGAAAGSYVGIVTCSSPGAASVTVPVAPSTVGLRPLIITANDQSKAFGSVFNAGTAAFVASGLVGGQTVGSVVLSAVGGSGLYDAAGAYGLVPSGATGGTFAATNYSISYVQGTLTVTAPSFAEWSAGLADPSAAGDPDGDGVVNLLEYYQGLDPAVADGRAAQIQWSGSELFFDYRRGKAIVGVTGAVEWTNELSGTLVWSEEGVADELIADLGVYETRRAIVPMSVGETKKFVHLRVSLP